MSSDKDIRKELPENQGMSQEEFKQLIQEAMAFKARSHETFNNIHMPELRTKATSTPDLSSPKPALNNQAQETTDTVLIGDSMLERLKTTGACTELAQLDGLFNAGCGGDKIENVLYRLSLMSPLLEKLQVRLWVVMVGTNNLRKKGLRQSDVPLYRLLLQALLRISPGSRALVCEIFKRKDIEDRHVDEANEMVQAMIAEINDNLGEERIFWSNAPAEVTKERLEDHVHLDDEGYRLWDRILFPRVVRLLAAASFKSDMPVSPGALPSLADQI
ncbi:hypothetical protein BGZ70_009111 [Mortierella alpina]|uniref:SGNH hydrolase-type esterase domain-containing protein n=1 Tax=Mortierella alpina TaxID=64518 RepID=A0A9P6M0R4_MORAP|nr:hypothetical protein BGZ70_009111 [Mortierella alpina]